MNQYLKNKNTIIKNTNSLNTPHTPEFYPGVPAPVKKQFIAWPDKHEKRNYPARVGRTKSGGYVAYP